MSFQKPSMIRFIVRVRGKPCAYCGKSIDFKKDEWVAFSPNPFKYVGLCDVICWNNWLGKWLLERR